MAWIADVAPGANISSTAWGNLVRDRIVQVFDSDAERNATAHPRDGMLAWTVAESRLALWFSVDMGWVVIFEPWRAWNPVVWSGPTTPLTTTANHGSQWRFRAFEVELFVNVDVLLGTTVPEDLMYIPPPVPPSRNGPFGVATVADPTHGIVGTMGFCDATHLAIQAQGTGTTGLGSLIHRGDLADSGTINWYMTGSYVVATGS